MNRDALLVYLHDLRDLEAARYQIEKMRKNNFSANKKATQKIQSEMDTVKNANYWKNPERPEEGFLIMFICGLGCFLGSFLWRWLGVPFIDKYSMIIGILGSIIFGIIYFLDCKDYIKAKRKVKDHNAKEKERLEVIVPSVIAEKAKIKQEIMDKGYSQEQNLRKELQKVNALLEDAYSLNILARPYRNLPSVYYIYEYMSTSQASLEETFMHEHMENGFQRIEKKLDIIIEQNEEIIFASRQIEANTERTVEQTKKMLNSLQKNLEAQQRTEQNTKEAAQYAAICTTYSRATAYFSMADYLRKGNYR